MKLATWHVAGREGPIAGQVLDDRAVAFADGSRVVDVLAGAGSPATGEESWALTDVTLLAPIPAPATVYAIGLNYALRQDSSTSDLIFGCDQLVAFIAETCSLRPGDLILTGTPNGVGMAFDPPRFLQSGDVVRIEIEQLGVIEHSVG